MRMFKVDLLDGKSLQVVVQTEEDADRLRKFVCDADMAFADQERWVKISKMMSHEQSGPHYGWTLGMVLPGDNPDEAIDRIREDS